MFGLGFLCGIAFTMIFAWLFVDSMSRDDLNKIIDSSKTPKKTPWRVYNPRTEKDKKDKK